MKCKLYLFLNLQLDINYRANITSNPGRLTFDGQTYEFTAGNLIDRGQIKLYVKLTCRIFPGIIGTGTYGVCSRMEHDASHKVMAVKASFFTFLALVFNNYYRELELTKSTNQKEKRCFVN